MSLYKKNFRTQIDHRIKSDCLLYRAYSKEEFQERREEVESEIATTKISLSEARIEQFDIEGALTYAANFIKNLGRHWFDLSPELRPRFQKLLFPAGLPYDREKGFRTAKLGLIYELNSAFDGTKSSLVDLRGIGPRSSACHALTLPLSYRPKKLLHTYRVQHRASHK